jgi:protein-tyrosine phosphatase
MAEGILKQALSEAGKSEYYVSSAGIGALTGRKIDSNACQLMTQKGLDTSSHRARQLTSKMIHKADLILVMETWQKNEIEMRERSAKGKVFRLGEWGKFDISDPYQKDLSDFMQSMTLIEQGVAQWVTKL